MSYIGEFFNFPAFKAEDVLPQVKEAIKGAKALLEQTLTASNIPENLTFDKLLFPLIEASLIVSRIWHPVSNILSLEGTSDFRVAADQARPLVIEFYNDLLLDPRVYAAVSCYAESKEAKNLSGERARYLTTLLRDLRLAGAALAEDKKEELRGLNVKLAELTRRFTDNVTDSKYELIVTNEDDLKGLPAETVSAAKHKANIYRENLGSEKIPENSWVLNLDFPCYLAIMRYAESGSLRKEFAFKYLQSGTKNARHGLLADPQKTTESLDNKNLIKEICALKARKAELLGFKNYAELSLMPKMAKTPEKVLSFLTSLATRAKPIAEKEYQTLVNFQKKLGYKNTENQPDKLFPWDREFLSEKLRKESFDYSSQETKPYFELRQSLHGMFSLATTLFGCSFSQVNDVPTWNSDVETYRVHNEKGEILGTLFLDLFPREFKGDGAWVNPLANSYVDVHGEKHHAQCILVCNSTQPTPDFPSLLSFNEFETLFHEFGHALHHLLSTVSLEPLSGLNVAYDFVEVPSQLLENFCYEESFLKTFARHYQTGEVIPSSLVAKIKKADRFLAGIICLRQLEFGLLDMQTYTSTTPQDIDADAIFRDVVKKYGVFDYWEGTHFPCSFTHIFSGGYAAGYYSYKWSELIEADVYSMFQNNGVLNPEIGRKYRDTILSKGDSDDPENLLRNFIGRALDDKAFLERLENTL